MHKIVAESSASFAEALKPIRNHEEKINISDGRIAPQVDQVNHMKTEIVDTVGDISGRILTHEATITTADRKADDLDARLATLTTQISNYGRRSTVFTQSLDNPAKQNMTEVKLEFEKHRAKLELLFASVKPLFGDIDKLGVGGVPQARGYVGSKPRGMDKKGISVWKLPEDLDKTHFRHWLDAFDTQLKLVHGCEHASYVLSGVPRSNLPMDKLVFQARRS